MGEGSIMNTVKPSLMWAPIVTGRSEWVWHYAIRRTRKAAKAAYLEGCRCDPKAQAEWLKEVRFVRVIVSVAPAPNKRKP